MDESRVDNEISAAEEPNVQEEADNGGLTENEAPENEGEEEIDYAKRVEEDLEEIRRQFPTLYGISDISDLKNPLRFGALRDLGLTVKEAFLASGGAKAVYDNRAHLTASVPKRASSGMEMSRKEYEVVKDLFSNLSDSEIKKLYQRATK